MSRVYVMDIWSAITIHIRDTLSDGQFISGITNWETLVCRNHCSLQHWQSIELLLSENRSNGEEKAYPASFFLVWSLQLRHRSGTRGGKSGGAGFRITQVAVDVFWPGLLCDQLGPLTLLSHQEVRRERGI